jgi:transcriptional regulator with XRE-family HTH domain
MQETDDVSKPESMDGRAHSDIKVGAAIRALRLRKRLTLKEVAEAAGLSESFLSQLERSRVNASIGSLSRVAAALNVSMAELFAPPENGQVRVIRKNDRPALVYGIFGRKYLLTPNPLKHLEVFIGEFQAGGSTGDQPYSHGDSDELFIVLSGQFELQVGENLFRVSEGDCVNYGSSMPHRAVNVGESTGEVMWIISPPSI